MGGTARGLILDRDGVVNDDSGYLHRIEDCRFVDGIFELTAAFAARGFAIVIATNQSGIGRGYYTEADFERLMAWMKGEFARRDVTIAGVYHSPDHPAAAGPRRKPGPGMLLEAARDLDLDLGRSWTVGDQMSDIEAGRAAGVRTLVRYDPLAPDVTRCQDFWVVPRLRVVLELLAREPG